MLAYVGPASGGLRLLLGRGMDQPLAIGQEGQEEEGEEEFPKAEEIAYDMEDF